MPMAAGAAPGSGASAGAAGRSAPPMLEAGAGDGVFDQFPPLGPDGQPIYPRPGGRPPHSPDDPNAGSGRKSRPGQLDADGSEPEDEIPWPAFGLGHDDSGPRWWTDETAAAIAARRLGRGIVVDYWASWCTGCRLLDATTLSDPSVRVALEGWFVPVKLDVSEDTAPNKARLSLRQIYSLPAILVLDARGRELARLGGYLPPDEFLTWLAAARARASEPVQEQRTASGFRPKRVQGARGAARGELR